MMRLKQITYLALLEYTIHFNPSTGCTLKVNTVLCELGTQGSSRLPCIVMRDFAGDVVENVCLRDAMSKRGSNPGSEAAKIAQKAAIHGGKSTTRESEFRCAVVGQNGVRVLQECD